MRANGFVTPILKPGLDPSPVLIRTLRPLGKITILEQSAPLYLHARVKRASLCPMFGAGHFVHHIGPEGWARTGRGCSEPTRRWRPSVPACLDR